MTNCASTNPKVTLALPEEITVCLVDDDPLILSLFTRVITRAGHNAIPASDADSALAVLDKHEVHLLLSDWRMPEPEDGERLLRTTRHLYPSLDVCIMSAEMHPDEQTLVTSLGARKYIQKPFSAETFTGIIASLKDVNGLSSNKSDCIHRGVSPS